MEPPNAYLIHGSFTYALALYDDFPTSTFIAMLENSNLPSLKSGILSSPTRSQSYLPFVFVMER